ncbi:hypothetical protein KAR48_02025 [bacterium]|nr:hypothetical protein [bacterium]
MKHSKHKNQIPPAIFRLTFFVCLSQILFAISVSAQDQSESEKTLPYTLDYVSTLDDSRIVKAVPIDIEKDGQDEILYLVNDGKINYSVRLYRLFGTSTLGQKNYPDAEVTDIGLPFKTPDGAIRICVTYKKNNTAYLDILDINLKLKSTIKIVVGQDIQGNTGWDGEVVLIDVADLNDDGYPDIVLKVNTAYDKLPRGIWVMDVKNREILWSYSTGTYINLVSVVDLNKDGLDEILVDTGAINNGASANGTNDSTSYIIILDNKGKSYILDEYEGFHSDFYAQAVYLNGSNDLKIVARFSNGAYDVAPGGKVIIYDADSYNKENEYKFDFIPNTDCFEIVDLDGNGSKEIIFIMHDLTPWAYILTDSLKLMKKVPLPFNVGTLLIDDLNGDGEKEIIISNRVIPRTLVLNHRFEKMARIEKGGQTFILKQGIGKSKLLGIHSPKEGVSYFELKKAALANRIPLGYIAISFISGVVLILIIQFLVSLFNPGLAGNHIIGQIFDTLPMGVIWLDRKNNIKYSNTKGRELCGIDTRVTDQKSIPYNDHPILCHLIKHMCSDKSHKQAFHGDVIKWNQRQFRAISIPLHKGLWHNEYIHFINDETHKNVAEQAVLWTDIAQKLAHELKNPLATIQFTLQRLQSIYTKENDASREKYDVYVDSSLEEIQRLRRVTDGFQRITCIQEPEKSHVKVAEFISEIENKLSTWIPDNIQFSVELESGLPDIHIDLDQFHSLFFNLIDNAAKAINGEGHIEIRATRGEYLSLRKSVEYRKWVLFEINDNGSGMTQEQVNTIFDPYISHREQGTGLGLTICKKIVEDHGGRIMIESNKGVGAHITIKIPVEDEDSFGSKHA